MVLRPHSSVAKYIIVPNSVTNDITTTTNSSAPWKHDWYVFQPINAPIDANNALMMMVDTTQKATGRITVSNAFPM